MHLNKSITDHNGTLASGLLGRQKAMDRIHKILNFIVSIMIAVIVIFFLFATTLIASAHNTLNIADIESRMGGTNATLLVGTENLLPVATGEFNSLNDFPDGVVQISTTQSDGLNNGSGIANSIMPSIEPTTTYHFDHATNDHLGTGKEPKLYPNPIGSGSSETTIDPLSIDSNESNGIRINIGENLGQSQSVNPNTDSNLLFAQAMTVPEVSISSNVNYIAEGSNAMFTVTATTLPSANIEVNVEFTVDGDFIGTGESNNSTKTATITSSGDMTGTVSFTTKADSPDGDHGLVTATLATGTGYSLTNVMENRSASIAVIDTLPKISIKPLSFADEADGYVNFMLESDFQPISGRDIEITGLRVRDANQFPPVYNPQLPQTPVLVTNANYNSIEVRVTFTKDPDFEAWTGIVLDLDKGDEYLTKDPFGEQRTVTIREEQLAPRKFSIDAPDYILEGDDLTFNLTTEQGTIVETFHVSVTIQHNNSTESRTIPVRSSPTEVTIQTATQTGSADSEIQLSIERGTLHDPDPTNGSKTITVQDKDLLPKVSIGLAGAVATFEEGEDVTLELSASAVTPSVASFTAYVQLTDDDTHDFLADATTTTQHRVTLSSGGTGTLVIPTVDDEVDEGTGGTIIATVQADPNLTDNTKRTTYLLSTTNPTSVMATIKDNDESELPSVTAPISAKTLPVPQISLGFTMIDNRVDSQAMEGEIALFSIQSDRVVSRALDVTVIASQSGNFIRTIPTNAPLADQYTHGVAGVNTVTIAAGRKVAFIGIATDNDQIDEENGTVTVSLVKDSSYSVKLDNLSDRQKSINVNDNDAEPVFSLETKYTKVSDTDFFEVSIVSNVRSEKQFAIDLSIIPPTNLTGLIASPNQSATVNFAPLASVQNHTIRVTADTATDTTDGHPVNIGINSSESYQVSRTNRSVQVSVVKGANLPTPTISTTNNTVNEGEPAVFNIVFARTATTSTTINLALTSEGNYLDGQTSDKIVIPTTESLFNYVIPTISNSGSGGSITVTLEPGEGYKLPPQSSRTVIIATTGSTQTPVLFIDNKSDSDNNAVKSVVVGSSGENAEFTVFSNVNPGPNFSVSYLPTNLDGDFLGTIKDNIQTSTVTFNEVSNSSPPLFSGALRVPVVQDANRKSGVIQVTLLDPAISTYSVYKYQNQATMRVIKIASSLPVISITGGGSFEEGQDGVFIVQADRPPPIDSTNNNERTPITVTVELMDSGSFLMDSSDQTVRISSTLPVPLILPTTANSTDESDGTVTAMIIADPAATDTYEVSANNTATITIVDNDVPNVPVVQVSTSNSVFEGRTAYFSITATTSTPLTQPLEVNIDLLIEENIGENEIRSKLFHQTVTIPISGRLDYEQMTNGDAVVLDRNDNKNGKITVTVRAHETNPASYSVGQNHKASTNVIDDDYENTVAVSVIGGGDIVEGENAFFTIRTDQAIETELPVNITIERNGTFFEHNSFLTPVITLPATSNNQGESSQSAYIYHIPTRYDQVDEPDGSVTISISDDPNSPRRYSVGVNPSATVVVMDDDEPGTVVSLHSDFAESGVTINKSFTFSVHTTTPVRHHTFITIEGQKVGDNVPDFVDRNISQRLFVFSPGTAARTSTVEIQNCSECPANFTSGRYVFTVKANPSLNNPYAAHPQFGKLEINIKNNDVSRVTHPVISIAPTSSEPVFAGENARFTLTSSQPITTELTINYWVSYQRIFSSDNPAGSGSVKFTVDSVTPNTHILEIPINKYRGIFDPAKLPVEIKDGVGYAIGVNSVAEVTVLSDISISLKSSTVPIIEGQIATFTFMSTKMLPKDFELNVRITDPGNYLPSNTTNTTKIILNPYGLDSNKQKFLYNLKTELDGVITAPNIIRMEILPGENYQIGTNSSAEIAVNDGNTNITVIPLSAEVTKGGTAHFRVAAVSKNLTSPGLSVVVKLGIVGNPNSIYTATNRDVNLRFTNGRVYEDVPIMIAADSNTDFELDGRLIVYIKNPDGSTEESYNLPSNGIYIGDNIAVMKVVDDDIPDGISIRPLKSTIIEGEVAEFQITANSTSESVRTINLVSSISDFLGSLSIPSTIDLLPEYQSVTLKVPTQIQLGQQSPGTIGVLINSGVGYTVAQDYSTALITVLDSIKPKFRLVRNSLRIPERQSFEIEIFANPVPKVDYNVKLNFESGDKDNEVIFDQNTFTFSADESSLRILAAPPSVTKDDFQVWSVQIEPVDMTQGRGRAHFKLPIYIIDGNQDATLTKPKVAVTAINSTIPEGKVARFEISVDHGDKMFNTVENNRIVNKVSSTIPPTLVHFRLKQSGIALPNYFTRPDPSDYPTDVEFKSALGEYHEKLNVAVPSLKDCTSYENLRFSCWVHESRNFNFPTTTGDDTQLRQLTLRLLGGEEDLLANYRIKHENAFVSVGLNDGALPVITVSTVEKQVSGRWLSIDIHADPAPSADTTIFLDIDDPAGLLRTDGTSFLKRPHSPFAVAMGSGQTKVTVLANVHILHNSFIPDGVATITVLPSVPIITGLAEIQYIVGPTTGTDNTKTSISRVLLYHADERTPPDGVSIFALKDSIHSGETAIFNIRTKEESKFTEDTTIKLVLDRNGSDVIAGPQILTREVLFPAGSWSEFLYLDTIDLPNFSEARTITARLQLNPDSEYTITSDNNFKTASITVSSSPKPLVASVVSPRNVITEGECAFFDISLTLPEGITSYQSPEEGFYLYYKVTSTAGNFLYSDDTVDYDKIQKIKIMNLNSLTNSNPAEAEPAICKLNRQSAQWNFTVPIQTHVDNRPNNGGKITLTLLDDPSNSAFYELGSTATKSTDIALYNRYGSVPEISISKGVDPTTNQEVDTITEGGTVSIVITMNPASGYRFDLQLQATETGDFLNVGRNGKNIYVDFEARVNKQEFNFDVFDDDVEEDDGMVTFTIVERDFSYNINNSQNSVSFTVMDNDDPPTIGINSTGSIQEGSPNTGPVVTLSNPTTKVVEYSFNTVDGSATSPADFTGASSLVTGTIPIGHTRAALPIPIIDDFVNESNENFRARITSVTNANFASGVSSLESTITIIDSDSNGFTIQDGSVNEGNSGTTPMNFTVTLTEAPNRPISVYWRTYNFEQQDFATAGEDFIAIPKTRLDFGPNETSKQIQVIINGDMDLELDETFSVGLSDPSPGIGIARAIATGRIISEERPVLPELSIANGSPVTEADGVFATFMVSANTSPNANLLVWFDLAESSDFISNEGNNKSQSLDFTDNATQANLTIPIVNDSDSEDSGTITVTLTDSVLFQQQYMIAAAPNNQAIVNVNDDESLPILTIADVTTGTPETTGMVNFILTTETNPGDSLMVRYDPSEVSTGNFLENASNNDQEAINEQLVNFSSNNNGITYTGTLVVPIHDDNEPENTGNIMVTLLDQENVYRTYQVGTDDYSAMATILDNEAPELKISGGGSVIEGDPGANITADFVVSAEIIPNRTISVKYNITETKDFVTSANETPGQIAVLIFQPGSKTATLSIPIESDNRQEDFGTITVTLIAESPSIVSYSVAASPDNEAMVSVYDDESPPIVSIIADNGTIAEYAGPAQFMLNAFGITATTTLMIKATPAEDGFDFLPNAGTEITQPVEFSDPDGDNVYTGFFPIPIDDDGDPETSGNIKLTLNANANVYEINPNENEGVIRILDNDSPELKIKAGEPVTEAVGAAAKFTITAAISPNKVINVQIDVIETEDFVVSANKGTNKTTSLDFSNGSTVATLSIPIHNDGQVEDDGTITVTIIADTASPITYTVAAAPDNQAVVEVIDDEDLPFVEIMADNGDVEANAEQATFKLTATGLTEATRLIINVTPDNVGNSFLVEAVAGKPVDFPVDFKVQSDGTYAGDLTITFVEANINQTGDIKLTINADPDSVKTYKRGSTTMGVVTINFVGLPELSITAGNPVTEADGAVVAFLISSTISPNRTITLHYNLSESGNYIDSEGNNKETSLNFSNRATEAMLSIPIVNDSEQEDSGTITVTLVADPGPQFEYEVAAPPANTAQVMVLDDDSLPIIEIIPDSGAVAENDGPAKFKLVAGGLSATTTLMINATPAKGTDEDGNNHDFLATSVENVKSIYSVEFSDQGNRIYFGELAVAIDNDDVGEETGSIKLTLHEPEVKSYKLGSVTEGTITVWDDDAPELSISGGDSVVEADGAVATFTISTEVRLNEKIIVYYMATEETIVDSDGEGVSNFLDLSETGTKSIEVDFSSGATSDELMIPLVNDPDNAGANANISVALVDDLNSVKTYYVAATNNTATVLAIDNGNPQIVIAPASSLITEGELATFNLTANFVIQSSVTVQFNVELDGDFVLWRTPSTFAMTADEGSTRTASVDSFSIVTHDDEIYEPNNGSITATLIAVPSIYGISPGNSATVSIKDNDFAPDSIQQQEPAPRISIANNAVDAILDFLQDANSGSAPSGERVTTLPTVSIHTTNSIIEEGSPAKFILTSKNLSETSNIAVKLSVKPVGDFFDFVESTQTLVRLQGTDSVPLIYQTIDDSIAEDDGRLEVSIIADPSYQLASTQSSVFVVISDAIDRKARQDFLTASAEAFLPDVVGNMAARTSEIIAQRVEQGFSESSGVVLNLGGEETLTGLIELSGEMTNKGEVSWREVLGDSAFAMTILSGDDVVTPTTIWGIGDHRNLTSSSSDHAQDWTGDMFTGHIGIDALINDRLITGISASVSESDVEFESTLANEIQFNSRTTSLNPYLGWTSKDQNSELQATLGIGRGELEIIQESYDNEILDSESYSFGLTGNQVLFSTDQFLAGTTKLNIKGDSWFAYRHVAGRDDILADFHTNTHHLRIRTEGTHQFSFATDSTLSPTISIGMRNDVKDHQSVLGLEVISGANYTNPIGLTVAGNGSMLIGAANQVQKVEVKSSLSYDRGTDKRGIIVEVSPTWGYIDANIQDTLWSGDILDSNFENGQYSNGASLNSEFGYGFEFLQGDGLITPISGFEVSSNQDYEYLIGTRLGLGLNANFELSGIQSKNTSGSNSSTVRLEGRFNW